MSYNINDLFVARNSRSGYQIEQSLRWTGTSGDDYFSFTPSTTGNRKKFTFSVWVKRGDVSGSEKRLFSAASGTSGSPARTEFGFTSGNRIIDGYNPSGSTWYTSTSPSVFRDPSAWYHIVLGVDTEQSTESNRSKIWINGVLMSGRNSFNAVVQNVDLPFNTSGYPMRIGDYAAAADGQNPFSGHMAELHYFDGTQITSPEDAGLGEFDDRGVWRPIKYTGGNYGTNGCYLKFDPSATNGLGHDYSGNGNNWTAGSGFATSGTGTDVMSDTPTTNWCTLNPLDKGEFGAGISLSEGNLKSVSTSSDRHVRSTFFLPTSGKWYWEMTATTVNTAGYLATGLYHATGSLTSTAVATAQGRWYAASGYGNGGSWGATYDDGDIIGIAVDMDSGKIWASKNNTWQASGDPVAGTNPMYDDLLTAYSDIAWSPVCANWQSGNTADFNFGQRAFAYTPPSGFSALNTRTLPAPSIKDGSDYFNTVLYTGNNTNNRTITGVGFQPDFVWVKNRSDTDGWSHILTDVVRGGGPSLQSANSQAEYSANPSGYVSAFASDGFVVTEGDTRFANTNGSGSTYVSWNWLAGGSGSSNTDGSITSTVSANPTAGFSIVSYTGNGTDGSTVGHGLGVSPSFILTKNRDGGDSGSAGGWWSIYHPNLPNEHFYGFNTTDPNSSAWNNHGYINTVSSTTWTLSTGDYGGTSEVNNWWVNASGKKYIAYCFAEIESYSKIGRYTGNANDDGPFVYCGFRPAWVMVKRSDGGGEPWVIMDNKRPGYNPNSKGLYANANDAENDASGRYKDFLSNGFKVRGTSGEQNSSGATYIFVAFAEHPFGGIGVSPATAR
jgi:hypothetical protein